MESFAGGVMSTAAANMAPGMAKKVFGYNRENFIEDREQRMKKEFAERKYRTIQGDLWREDVRDFVSLTEQKMSLYLIINVLLLSFTVTLWVEGQLPETTPDWLVMGYQISCVVAFSFLLLTVWLAMHGAIAAQSYQVRVLTQLVRLPIPTWKELEACRTSASEFEKLESRQMFRVPFVTGSQERFVPGNTATNDDSVGNDHSGNSGAIVEAVDTSVATDPWGLEQRGDSTYELGTHTAEEVANLRHIKLLRQAAVYWQTYDAFARVSMSVGINQLMLGMSYYILGYAMLENKAPCAAIGGVLAFMGSAEVIARVDLTLSPGQMRLVQLLVAVGPIFSILAAYLWSFHREEQADLSELLAPLAYISNGFAVGIMTIFVQVEEQENGAMIPNAFRSVLFLDVFGWVSTKKDAGEDASEAAASGNSALQGEVAGGPGRRRCAKPAASAVNYDRYGRSLPAKAAEDALAGSLEDMRYLPGAPRSYETVNAIEPPAKDFWDPVTFMPPEGRTRTMFDQLLRENDSEDLHSFGEPAAAATPEENVEEVPIVTGHDHEAPGIAPWRIFRNLALITTVVWICAGVWSFMKASEPELIEMGLAFEDPAEEKEAHHHPVMEEGPAPVHPEGKAQKGQGRASLISVVQDVSRATEKAATPQHVNAMWPYPGIVPKGLSCDAQGNRLLVTDGLSTFVAELQGLEEAPSTGGDERTRLRHASAFEQTPRAQFKQVTACPSLLGESLQDTALSCAETSISSCEALVLHRQGRRVAACKLTESTGSRSFDVTTSWLTRPDPSASGKDLKLEQARFLMVDPACMSENGHADILSPGCTSVGTTHGRAARLQLGEQGSDLVLLDVTEGSGEKDSSKERQTVPDGMRPLTERYMGILTSGDKSIEILDLDKGAARVGKLALASKGPVQAFCASKEHIYLMGSGPHPELSRLPLPDALKPLEDR